MQFLNPSLTEAHNILKSLDKAERNPSIGAPVYAWDGDDFTSLIYRGILTEVHETTKVVDGIVKATVKFEVADEFNNNDCMTFDHVVKLGKSSKGRKVFCEEFIGHIYGKLHSGELVIVTDCGYTVYMKPEDVIDFDWEKAKVACAKKND